MGTRDIFPLSGAILCLLISLSYVLPPLIHGDIRPDFSILWTAGRFALGGHDVYNQQLITEAQHWIWPNAEGLLPFAYPPSALPLFAIFAALAFWPAFAAWTAASFALFYVGARQYARGWALPLSLASPPVVLTALLGQTALLLGGLTLIALSMLRSRPFVAGALFGIVAAIKPQSMILAPILLASDRRAFAGAMFGGLAMILLSLPFGLNLWRLWPEATLELGDVLSGYGLERFGATPALLAKYASLPAWPILCITVPLGALMVWKASQSDDACVRALGFATGTLIASPYAMRNELALATPMLVSALLAGTKRGALISLPLYAPTVVFIVPSLFLTGLLNLSGTAVPGWFRRYPRQTAQRLS